MVVDVVGGDEHHVDSLCGGAIDEMLDKHAADATSLVVDSDRQVAPTSESPVGFTPQGTGGPVLLPTRRSLVGFVVVRAHTASLCNVVSV